MVSSRRANRKVQRIKKITGKCRLLWLKLHTIPFPSSPVIFRGQEAQLKTYHVGEKKLMPRGGSVSQGHVAHQK